MTRPRPKQAGCRKLNCPMIASSTTIQIHLATPDRERQERGDAEAGETHDRHDD